MQKKLIALAIAGIVSAPAFAQSNVTVYGRADYGFMNRSGTSGAANTYTTKSEFASGINGGSRLGFKGSEDLGNNMKAIFEIEFGLSNDASAGTTNTQSVGAPTAAGTSAATFNNRHSYVGLTGNFGTVVGGRLDGVRYGIWTKYDAFGGGGMGNITQISKSQVDRADNAIAYISPRWNGFQLTGAYATSLVGQEGTAGSAAGLTGTAVTADGNINDLVLNTLMVNYANGPIDLTADYETAQTKNAFGTGTVAATGAVVGKLDAKVITVAGSYDFGVMKLRALYDINDIKVDNVDANKHRAWMLSASVPFAGKWMGKISIGQTKDKATSAAAVNNNVNTTRKTGLGLEYAMSKRTSFYTNYGSVKNDDVTAATRVSAAPNAYSLSAGNNPAAMNRVGTNGFDLGVGHNF
jgi:predicted porin